MRSFRCSDPGLFKATSAWSLSWELLQQQLGLGHDAAENSTAIQTCFSDLPVVTGVDVFVSHAWSTSPGLKFLAMCHYLNLSTAVKAACMTWICTGLVLVVQAGGISRVATASGALGLLELVLMLVYWPMLVFFLVYFLGHRWHSQKYWFDKLCVHQTDLQMKNQAIDSLPHFVINSRKLLVLWDESYFEPGLSFKSPCEFLWRVRSLGGSKAVHVTRPLNLPAHPKGRAPLCALGFLGLWSSQGETLVQL